MNLTAKYNVELIAKDGQHFYTVNGSETYLPGVTGILGMISKPALVPWSAKESVGYVFKTLEKVKDYKLTPRFLERLHSRAKKQPHFAKETAARNGTIAHGVFDAIVKIGPDAATPTPFLPSFLFYLKKESPKFITGDLKVASLTYGFGGSLDALAEDENGKLVILDWKTGKSIWPEMAAQVSAYSFCVKEMFGLDYYPAASIIRFEKDKEKYEQREVRDIKDSFKLFKTALDLHWLHKLEAFSSKKTVKPQKKIPSRAAA